jgi:hypothetical protein
VNSAVNCCWVIPRSAIVVVVWLPKNLDGSLCAVGCRDPYGWGRLENMYTESVYHHTGLQPVDTSPSY